MEVDQDTRLEPGETQRQNAVLPRLSRSTQSYEIRIAWPSGRESSTRLQPELYRRRELLRRKRKEPQLIVRKFRPMTRDDSLYPLLGRFSLIAESCHPTNSSTRLSKGTREQDLDQLCQPTIVFKAAVLGHKKTIYISNVIPQICWYGFLCPRRHEGMTSSNIHFLAIFFIAMSSHKLLNTAC